MGAGESAQRVTAAALPGLESSGWSVLHDRRAPDGGNIDHLAIGPPGIAVIDSKNWREPITITPERRLVFSKYDRTDDLDRLSALTEHVRSLVAGDGVKVAIRGYLSLVGEADRDRPAADLGDLRIVGVDGLAKRLAGGRADLDADLVAAITASLEIALPPMGAAAAAPSAADAAVAVPSPMFEKAHRFYFLSPWRKGGHDRMYLRNARGTTLGWTDLKTGATTIECGDDEERFARTLLAAADRGGVKVAPGDLPKVPTRLFGGRLLSRIARLHTSVLLGQEWRNFGKHRLYGTLIDPSVASFDLGHVDLKAGTLHPSMEGKLHEDRQEPARYLAFLHHHFLATRAG